MGSGGRAPPLPITIGGLRFPLRLFVALAGLLFAIAFASYFLGGRASPPSPPSRAALAQHGCTLHVYRDEGYQHLSGDPASFTVRYAQDPKDTLRGKVVVYDSFPPTSGPHGRVPAPFRVYASPPLEVRLVHDLEHGGIVVQYGRGVPAATVARVRAWVESSPDGMILAPLPALGSRIVLSAWTALSSCTRFDPAGFALFRDVYRFKGPERLPRSALKPAD